MKIITLRFLPFLFLFFGISGCGPVSSDDYQTLASSEMHHFVILLKKIHDPGDLKKNHQKIKNRFNKLSKIMIDYRFFLEKHPEISDKRTSKMEEAAFNLKNELYRIYALDGGSSLIEDAQQDAYLKLSLFEHSLTQERIDMYKSRKPLSKG